MVESTLSVSSFDALREAFADYLSRRAKTALEKARKLYGKDSDSYRLVATEFTDESDFWRQLKIEVCDRANQKFPETDAVVGFTVSVSSLADLQQEFVDDLSRRAKQALAKANKLSPTEAEPYRLVAMEFKDASAFWQRLKIVMRAAPAIKS